jgi:hypothetical protein
MCPSTSTVYALLHLPQSTAKGQTVLLSLMQKSMPWNVCGFGSLHWGYLSWYNLTAVVPFSCVAVYFKHRLTRKLHHWKNSTWLYVQFTGNECWCHMLVCIVHSLSL